MNQASSHSSLHSSRLVRLLTGLGVADVQSTHQHFSLRLAQLIDLPDSIKMASAQLPPAASQFEPVSAMNNAVAEQFLRVRAAMIRAVAKSFSAAPGYSRIKLPLPPEESPSDLQTAMDPYLKFYRAHQRQIEFTTENLQVDIRHCVAGLSPTLAQLVKLDTVLGDTLSPHARKFFTVVPECLRQRSQHLYQEFRRADNDAGGDLALWLQVLARFHNDMRELLLAEIETRLLPVLGLVEATHQHLEKDTL